MSYAIKYQTRAADLSGFRYRVLIEQDGWEGGVTDVAPSKGFYDEETGQQGTEKLKGQPIQVSSVRFAVDASPGLLTELFDAPDREYRVTVERQRFEGGEALGNYENHWRGFLVTDFYEDQPFEDRSRIELEAIDGLALLKDEPYEPPEPEENIWDAFERILHGLYYLKRIAGEAVDLRVHQQWKPGGSDYDVPDPAWKNLTTQKANWDVSGEGENPVWASQWDFLTQALTAFGCTLRQSGFQWVVRQRSGAQETGDVVYQREVVNPDYAPIEPSPIDRRDASAWKFERGARRSFLQRRAQAQTTYKFGDALTDLLENPGFEANSSSKGWTLSTYQDDEDLKWGAEVVDADDYDPTPSRTQSNQKQLRLYYEGGGAKDDTSDVVASQTLPIDIRQGPSRSLRVSWQGGTGTYSNILRPWLRVQVGGFYLQKTRAYVKAEALKAENGVLEVEEILPSGSAKLVPEGVRLPIFREKTRDDDYPEGEQVGSITLTKPISCGDAQLRGQISPDIEDHDDITYVPIYHWGTQTEKPRIHELFTNPDVGIFPWERMAVETFLQTPTGTPVSGTDVQVELGAFFGFVSTSTLGLAFFFDDFAFGVRQEGKSLTQITTVATLGEGAETTSTVRIGDGPSADANSRIRAQDSGGTWHNLTSDWGVGSGGTLSLSELRARESLRQRRKKVETRTVTFQLRDGQDLHPHEIIEWDGALWDVGYMRRQAGGRNIGRVTVELRKLEDFGAGGIEYQYAQSSEPTRPGTVNVIAGGVNDNGSGPDGTLDWDNVVDKDELVNTLNNRQGHVQLLESDVTGALGYDPQSEIESLARHLSKRNALTHTTEEVASGDVSTLPVKAQSGDPVLQAGNPIALINAATGRPVEAQVSSDMASGDTSIDVAAPDGTTLTLDEPLEAESGVYYGHQGLLRAVRELQSGLSSHVDARDNPHEVRAEQVENDSRLAYGADVAAALTGLARRDGDLALYDFEDGLGEWTAQHPSVDTSGSGYDSGSALTADAEETSTDYDLATLSVDGRPVSIQFRYNERSGSEGAGLFLRDAAGKNFLKAGTSNPDYEVESNTEAGSISGSTYYGDWAEVRIHLDWEEQAARVQFEDLSSGDVNETTVGFDTRTLSVLAFNNANSIGGGNKTRMRLDDVLVRYPGYSDEKVADLLTTGGSAETDGTFVPKFEGLHLKNTEFPKSDPEAGGNTRIFYDRLHPHRRHGDDVPTLRFWSDYRGKWVDLWHGEIGVRASWIGNDSNSVPGDNVAAALEHLDSAKLEELPAWPTFERVTVEGEAGPRRVITDLQASGGDSIDFSVAATTTEPAPTYDLEGTRVTIYEGTVWWIDARGVPHDLLSPDLAAGQVTYDGALEGARTIREAIETLAAGEFDFSYSSLVGAPTRLSQFEDDLGVLTTEQKGAARGVATLTAAARVPEEELPERPASEVKTSTGQALTDALGAITTELDALREDLQKLTKRVSSLESADTTRPARPSVVSADGYDGYVEIRWDANTDDTQSYRLYRNGALYQEGITDSYMTDNDVQNGTTYRYEVSAVDEAGNESPLSVAAEATPTAS